MKLYKYTNKKSINYMNTDQQVEIPEVFNKKDIRAMWISNVANIDLPVIDTTDNYKKLIIQMLDTCLAYNVNTVYFQVRTTNDAFYESKLNPYSRFFTGKEGLSPDEDILKWIIKETKNRHISFHAWCNPYRVSYNGKMSIEEYLDTCDDLNLAKRHPEYLVLDKGGKLILNPALPEVQKHIIDSMKELVSNYDVDGIHFDDYFYPYSGLHEVYNDLKEFDKQDIKDLGDFRRNNVNKVIEGVHNMLKKEDSSLQFGVSPFGIWKNKTTTTQGSNTDPACSESYYGQYADSVKWIQNDMIDYIVPQIYWEFGHKIAPFADICDFWIDVCKDSNVDLLIGHAAYRLGNDGEFENNMEIVNQLKYANQSNVVKGNVFFTYKTFISKDKSLPGMRELRNLLNKE
jgi:uncharacterized lipoprotein YddW (UPF0748 family)